MPNFQRRPLALAILLTFAAPPLAIAQSRLQVQLELPPIEVEGTRDRGYVTDSTRGATRTETPLRDIPQTVNVVPQELIRAQNVTSLADALRNVPGITLTAPEGGTSNQQNFWLRGFPAGGDVFLDSVRDVGEYNRDLFNVESVEVLKGPSALMFGRGSTGGVINQSSKLPYLDNGTEVAVTLGSYEQRRMTLDSNVTVGERAALRVNVMGEDSNSFRDTVAVKKFGVAPTLRLGIGTDTDVTLSYFYLKDHTPTEYGQPTLGAAGGYAMPPVSVHEYFGLAKYDFTHLDTQMATATIDHHFDNTLSLRETLRWARYRRDMEATIAQSLTDLAGQPVTATTPLDQMLAVRNHNKARDNDDTSLVSQTELTWRVDAGDVRHTVLGGVELGQEKFDRTVHVWTNALSSTPYLAPDPWTGLAYVKAPGTRTRTQADTAAAYLQDQVAFDDTLKAVAGLRYEHYRAKFNSVLSATGEPAGTPPSASRTDNMAGGRLGLIWQPTQRQSYYVSWGNSYNPSGELGVYGGTGTNLTNANLDVDPERNNEYEAGAQWDLGHGLQVRTAIFRNEKTNGRVTDPALGQAILEGKRRVDGVEAEVTGQITRRWQVYAAAAYMDGEVHDGGTLNPGGTTTLGGKHMTIPSWSGNVWTKYDLGFGWQAGLGVQATAWRWADESNRGKIPGFALVNAMIGYLRPDWDVQLNVNNVLDKRFYVSGYQNNPTFVVPGNPLLVSLTARYRF
jgi:catecholate siderophore receptor